MGLVKLEKILSLKDLKKLSQSYQTKEPRLEIGMVLRSENDRIILSIFYIRDGG